MIPIKKGLPLSDLVLLQQKAQEVGASPEDAFAMLRNPLKGLVRDQLVTEQGGLCAYCMCRIPRNDVGSNIPPIVIEHFIARNPEDGQDVGQGLDYKNLLAVCHGNRGVHKTRTLLDLTCDAHRGNTNFRKINPVEPETLTSIFYHIDGRIDARDSDVQYDLIEVLNLNCPTAPIISERKAALDALIQELEDVPEEDFSLYCQTVLNSFLAESDMKTPYVGILVWYLSDLSEKLTNT